MLISDWTITLIGSVAAALTTVAFVPQVIRVWRLKDARDISLPTFLIFSVGLVAWLVYGIYIASVPVIVANVLTLILSLTIVTLKLRYGTGTPGVGALPD